MKISKALLPRKLKEFILRILEIKKEASSKSFDLYYHLRFSFKEHNLKDDQAQFKYYLTKHYHIVEKGLALPEPRLGFGQPKIADIIEKAQRYESLFGSDELTASIRKTLKEYIAFNSAQNFELPIQFENLLSEFIQQGNTGNSGGLKDKKKNTSSTLTLDEYKDFAIGRTSVRNFSEEPVSIDLLYKAADIAKNAPSVCNRQGWKIHCYSDKNTIINLLSYQNGNAGFTHTINKLLIVTADVKAFTNFESNQAFIDGGLFSMNLLLAIHAAGLGACCLNTCYPSSKEKEVKTAAAIPDNERLIMMIAVGNLKNDFSVAYSPRNPTEQIFVPH
ncbi:nitroreductase family protein [Cycloclasticus pugetii]|uniref:nitroreductase family protein n=1 Tax=Cycloclasticus pugetii TaxID=34068 RepID=UPI003A8E65F7